MATYWNDLAVLKDISKEIEEGATEHINFDDNDIYASTDLGLYRTYNGNLNLWFFLLPFSFRIPVI